MVFVLETSLASSTFFMCCGGKGTQNSVMNEREWSMMHTVREWAQSILKGKHEIAETTEHLIAGIAGGAVATASLYPLELVKTRMQVIRDGADSYRSMGRAFEMVVKREGFTGLYQGVGPALFAASGSWGGYFFFYEESKNRKMGSGSKLTTVDHLLSGVEAGVILVFMFNPIWVAKTRLALQGAETGPNRRYTGTIDCLRTIVKEEGVSGLYKGLTPALLLTSHGAVQIAVYEAIKNAFKSFYAPAHQRHCEDSALPSWVSVVNGGASKIIASTVTYPYQLIKSKLQQRDFFNPATQQLERRYTSTLDCAVKVWRAEGFPGFFRGVVPNALKVAPSASITFFVYEELRKVLGAGRK